MTIEEAAERLRELPSEWWRVGMCHVSAEATIAPDCAPSDEMRAFDERFNSGFDVDIRHTAQRDYTCAEAPIEPIERAKAITAFEGQGDYVPGRVRP